MKVRGDFLGPPRSTDKTTLIIKVIRLQRSGIDTIKPYFHIKSRNISQNTSLLQLTLIGALMVQFGYQLTLFISIVC